MAKNLIPSQRISHDMFANLVRLASFNSELHLGLISLSDSVRAKEIKRNWCQ